MTNKVFRSQWIRRSFAISVSTWILHWMTRVNMFAIFTIKICFITVTWRFAIGVGWTFSSVQTRFLIFCFTSITISIKLTFLTWSACYLNEDALFRLDLIDRERHWNVNDSKILMLLTHFIDWTKARFKLLTRQFYAFSFTTVILITFKKLTFLITGTVCTFTIVIIWISLS